MHSALSRLLVGKSTTPGTDVKLPDDDMETSSIEYIKRHCFDIYFYDINCAFVGYNKK